MKIVVKPVTFVNHPELSPVAPIVTVEHPRLPMVQRSFQYLVTSHDVPPVRARELVGLGQK